MKDTTREGIIGIVQSLNNLQLLVIDEMKEQSQPGRKRVFRCIAQLEYMRNELAAFLEKPFMDIQAQPNTENMRMSSEIIRNGQGW